MHALLLAPLLVLAQQPQVPEHLRAGLAQLQRQALPEAIATFEAVVRENAEDGQAWYFLGLARHSAGELDEALRGHLLASLLVSRGHPFYANAPYNIACVYSLKGNAERGLQWLHRARNRGFANFGLLGTDTDLDSLREDERFAAFVANPAIASEASSTAVESVVAGLPGNTGGVAVGSDGVVYAADFGQKVFRVTPDGEWEEFADGFTTTADCTLDAEGNLLQVDHGTSRVWSIAPDGSKTDLGVEGLTAPVGIDTGSDGALYVTNYRTNAITHVAPDGTSSTIASGGLLNGPNGIAWAGEHGVFIVNYNDGAVLHLDPKNGALRFVAELPGGGNGHVAWSGEALYVTGRKDHRIYRVTPQGAVARVAGDGRQGVVDGDAAQSRFSLPNGIALSQDGLSLFVNDNLGTDGSVLRAIRLAPATD